MLHCSGAGDMLVSSYGAIVERQLQPGEVFTVDTGHIVAFDEGVTYAVRKVGNWKSTPAWVARIKALNPCTPAWLATFGAIASSNRKRQR